MPESDCGMGIGEVLMHIIVFSCLSTISSQHIPFVFIQIKSKRIQWYIFKWFSLSHTFAVVIFTNMIEFSSAMYTLASGFCASNLLR